ncbi:hypothetical protein FALBO_2152 [Fusarium albosuccineum]|uniref:ASST-domain-containing protein n=1 Tax=Fusarium albosuccineum TaxID=1237068 RepID=A0A8H4LMJ6_9HYPO|nr:hypothetical protein FALBO_2152 [Fusarium albosuccineum]
MVVVSGSPWAKRLIYVAISLNLLLWLYVLQTHVASDLVEELQPPTKAGGAGAGGSGSAGAVPAPVVETKTLPTFHSWSHFELITPKNPKTFPFRKFKSSPHNPPHISWSANGRQQAKGYVFITPQSSGEAKGLKQAASFIMKTNAEMVYAYEDSLATEGMQVQSINNAQYLTLWRGVHKRGYGYGEVVLINDEYEKTTINLEETISNMFGQKLPGYLDFHEQQLTTRGTILVTAYNTTIANLSAIGGSPRGWVSDSMFFEIDIETQEILFRWSSLDHFEPKDSMLPRISSLGNGSPRKPYDYFHLNSVQAIGHDSFLISSRHFSCVYLISRFDGRVLWELKGEGTGGSFGELPTHGQFRWQNHVRGYNVTSKGMIVSMFDNHNIEMENGNTPSRGLLLKLKLPPDTSERPTVLRTLQSDTTRFSTDYGSYQLGLSNNNQFISYGAGGVVQEFGPGDGKDVRWEGRFGHDESVQAYRAFKEQWHGTPTMWSPALVVEKPGNNVVGYVSWNGATDIEGYNVYLVEPDVSMRPLGRAITWGFETAFDLPVGFNETNCIMVAAVRQGREVRQSNVGCIEGQKFKSTFKVKPDETSLVSKSGLQKILGKWA